MLVIFLKVVRVLDDEDKLGVEEGREEGGLLICSGACCAWPPF
jgi:hypothetical protein